MSRWIVFSIFLSGLIGFGHSVLAQNGSVDPQVAAMAFKKQSDARRDSGDYEGAQAYLDSSIHVLNTIEASPKLNQSIGWKWANKGFISSHYQGRILLAKRHYQQAAQHLEQSDVDSMLVARHVYKSLGNIYTRLGDYAHAIEYLQKVLDLATQRNDSVLCLESCNDLAIALLEDQQQPRSIDLIRQYLHYAETGSLRYSLLQSNLARALYESKQLSEAKRANAEAIEGFQSLLKDSSWSHRHRDAQNYLLGCHTIGLYIAGELDKKAVIHEHEEAGKALIAQLFGSDPHRKPAKYWIALGTARLQLDEPKTALIAFQKAYKILAQLHRGKDGSLYPEQLLVAALDGEIKCYLALQADHDSASWTDSVFNRYDQLFVLEAAVRSELLSGPSRLRHARQFHRLGCEAVHFTLGRHRTTKDPALLEKALEYVAYSQGILLSESLAEQLINSNNPSSHWQELMQLEQEIADLRLNEAENNEALHQAHVRKSVLVADLQTRDPLLYDQWFAPASRDIRALKKQFNQSDKGLLVFFDTGDSLVQFLLSAGQITAQTQVFDRELKQQLQAFHAVVQNPNAEPLAFKTIGFDLYQKLFGSFKQPLPAALTVIPDGRINQVALPLLVTDPEGPDQFSSFSYVLLKHAIHYVPSIGFLQHPGTPISYPSDFLLVRPDFSCNEAFAPLPALHTHQTADALIVEGAQATSASFLGQSGQVQIAHLATHGFAVSDDANASWIALADSSNCQHQKLYFDQIRDRSFRCDLLVLQACQSASGSILDGEGISSMSHGFLHAGCQNVLASTWDANPVSTSKIISSFYEQLDPDDLSGSLRLAQLQYLGSESTDALAAHPFYWGGLQVFGVNHLPGTTPKSSWFYWILGSLTSLLLLFVGYRFWSKSRIATA